MIKFIDEGHIYANVDPNEDFEWVSVTRLVHQFVEQFDAQKMAEKCSKGKNPKYKVRYAKKADPLICYSKTYDHRKNPSEDFVAIMTCSDADEACPVVNGAEYRTTIKYDDPKKFDGTDKQEDAYLERSDQIGREMFYVFKKVAELKS
jgi:hypothetical protein